MGVFSDRIFNEIAIDYLEKKSDSFLYRYLREENPGSDDKKIEKKATDLMYNLGHSLAAMRRVLAAENKRDKFDTEGGVVQNKEEWKLKKQKKEKLEKAVEEAKEKASRVEGRKGTKTGKAAGGKNTALSLVDGWISGNAPGMSSGRGGGGGADIDSCVKMFDLIKMNKDYEGVRIPLQINGDTGATLYILGNKQFGNRFRTQKEKRLSCQLVIYGPEVGDDGTLDIAPCDWGFDGDIREAFVFMEKAYRRFMRNISDGNEGAPEGTPEEFMKYWDRYDLEDTRDDIFEDVLSYNEEDEIAARELFGVGRRS